MAAALSVARFAFDPDHPRAQLDGARIISHLMRRMDFGTREDNGSVIVVFAETDLRSAHAIARRLSSVMRQTSHGKRDARSDPTVTVAALLPGGPPARCWRGSTARRNAPRPDAFAALHSGAAAEHCSILALVGGNYTGGRQ